jgi:hypothetical protein
MTEGELKPCPFCGGEVKIKHQAWGTAGLLTCNGCRILFLVPWAQSGTLQDLAEVWNRRKEKA